LRGTVLTLSRYWLVTNVYVRCTYERTININFSDNTAPDPDTPERCPSTLVKAVECEDWPRPHERDPAGDYAPGRV
jgi:hypothetical protein